MKASRWKRRLGALLATLALFCGVVWFTRLQFVPVSSSPAAVKVDIPLGANAGTIADRLKQAGLIRSTLVFRLTARVIGASESMKAGEYRIPRNLGMIEIIDRLMAGAAEARWVVIPEGKTMEQVAALLDRQRLASAGEFLRAARRKPQAYGLNVPVPRNSVEGYLMPDSYKFPTRVSERALIKEMLRNWKQKVLEANRATLGQSGMPLDKLVVIASLIEREAKVPEDRPLISSVIRNRLAKKMPLQVDATVLYAMKQHKQVVTNADLKTQSAYNTYRRPGLPPGPICSPGLDCILAAARPAASHYLYYVAKPDGSHIFSQTFEQHRAAIQKVRAMKKAASAGGPAEQARR
ncbi:MAG TPA: endolytic transglycosylase MltG [Armatimonadota bacterium]|nr:endolytic transglycosylase MltG [Armatimonadota bacterium]